MPEEKVTKEQILEVLKKNGIESIDDLADQLSKDNESPQGAISKIDNIEEVAASWIIKVWKLDNNILDSEQIKTLPEKLGGDLLKTKNGL